MRTLCIDYGDKRVGFAVIDQEEKIAFPHSVFERTDSGSFKELIGYIKEIIYSKDIKKIVLGYPLRLDGTEDKRCFVTKEFKARLERNFKKIPVYLVDERLSTAYAKTLSQGIKVKELDDLAACNILQLYMDKR